MALSLMLLCLVASAAAQPREWTVAENDEVQRLGATNAQLGAICDKICSKGQTMAPYPGACNLFVWCVESQLRIHVQQCSGGTVYSDTYKTCVGRHFILAGDPCGGQNDPCISKQMMPDKNGCKYHQCEGEILVERTCPRGQGFDVATKQCTEQARPYCRETRYRELEFTCQPVGRTSDSYNKTVTRYVDVSGTEQREPFTITLLCPAGLYYPADVNNCSCILKPEKQIECKDFQLVDLSSARDTWVASSMGAPGMYKLEGNLTLDSNGQAYVTQSDLHVPALLKNDLGNRWNLSMTFTVGYKRPDGSFQSGFTTSTNGMDIALVDNSVCENAPTFGCRMRRVTNDGFTVICFANDHEVISNTLNVGRPVTVTLSRVDSVGRMVVSSQGQAVDQKAFQFGEMEQVKINECPLTIGYSAGEQDFSGYMDNIFLFKYACN